MSQETLLHLNTNTLIGFTDKRGHAWHYRESLQGKEPNHYAGAVPIGDVERRLFSWQAVSRRVAQEVPATFETMTHFAEDGTPMRWDVLTEKQAISRDDNDHNMGIFAEGYQPHQYREWLLNTVSNLIGDTLFIGSAGLLKNGAVAWVSVEVPDSIQTPEGVIFRPNLLACTSFDGSLATTYKRVIQNVVCDNTMRAGLSEDSEQLRYKHSRNSKVKIDDAKAKLHLINEVAEEFEAEVRQLCQIPVAPKQFSIFLDELAPVPTEKGRGQTLAMNKQDTLRRLWNHDERVAPWKGTAFGVLQAVNTYTHHEGTVRGADRAERNMLRAVTGGVDKLDQETMKLLTKVLAAA